MYYAFPHYLPPLFFRERPRFLDNDLIARMVFIIFVMRFETGRERLVFQIPRMLLEPRDRDHARLRHLIGNNDSRDLPYFLFDFSLWHDYFEMAFSRMNVFARAIAFLAS